MMGSYDYDSVIHKLFTSTDVFCFLGSLTL